MFVRLVLNDAAYRLNHGSPRISRIARILKVLNDAFIALWQNQHAELKPMVRLETAPTNCSSDDCTYQL